ncbi:pilus assembly PilX N-terminal domain-containing protein [Thioalkalivibrio sp. AKL9]|uniref:pilus assembly PilX family protein n=2 Tax=unclassified Thioalkalivibrio TaxID=2621013 RepID=UPI00037CD57B|nr:pilus assembly PilX N-terminal domain-containing protein [Thioalkalivibrio sp. AKL9]
MTSYFSRLPRRGHQKGLATLLITVIILVAITLVIIFASQTAILEQRMSANELRMKQTNNAAQAGLEVALAYAAENNRPPGWEDNGDSFLMLETDRYAARAAFLAPTAASEAFGTADAICGNTPDAFAQAVANLTSASGDPLLLTSADEETNIRNAVALSCGWSDDRAGRKAILVGVQAGPSIANPPDNPLVTRGGLAISGTAAVYNAYTDTNIRSGGEINTSGGGTGNSFLLREGESRPSTDPANPDPVPLDGDGTYVQESRGDLLGLDVIDRDDNFGVTGDEFFESFMGSSMESYKENQIENVLESNGDRFEFDASEWGQTIWIEGDAELTGTLGSRENPVLLVVEGDLRTTGNFQDFHGILYITGDLIARGNPRFFGAAIVQGRTDVPDDAEVSGTPFFYFDPIAAGGAGSVGARSLVSGSWRDWTHGVD